MTSTAVASDGAVSEEEDARLTIACGSLSWVCKEPAIIQGDMVYLPVRDVFDAYNVHIQWAQGEAEKKIVLTTGSQRYQLVLDYEQDAALAANDLVYEFIQKGEKIYLPAHFFGDVINCPVSWDGSNMVLTIDKDAPQEAAENTAGVYKPLVNLPVYEKTVAVSRAAAPAPRPETTTYLQDGIASWYGDRFHGGRTASGEAYNMHDYTAAHPTLPFGTIVRVTALYNGASVDVRINDRGPYYRGRVIDLSRAAAAEIGLVSKGICAVKLEVVSQ